MNRLFASPIAKYLAFFLLIALAFAAYSLGYFPPHSPGAALTILGAGIVMSPSGARVTDPVLTTVAQGYQNGQMVGQFLFPVVPVDQRGGKIIQFGKEDFVLYNTARAPGANTKRVQYGYMGNPFALESHSLEGLVPLEIMQEANAVPHIDMGKSAVLKTLNTIQLSAEYAAANLARNAANYSANNKVALSGTDKWSDYSGTSDPTADIDAAVEAIRSQVGKRANTVTLSPAAFKAAKRNPKLLDRVKYTSRDSLTAEMLASLWDVQRVVVGDAIYIDGNGNMADVWGTDVVVAYTELGTLADNGLPSYGYTYRLRGYPMVEVPYQDRNAQSWVYPVTDARSPVLAGASAGFLIQNAA